MAMYKVTINGKSWQVKAGTVQLAVARTIKLAKPDHEARGLAFHIYVKEQGTYEVRT